MMTPVLLIFLAAAVAESRADFPKSVPAHPTYDLVGQLQYRARAEMSVPARSQSMARYTLR
jgi:hypothetical protein